MSNIALINPPQFTKYPQPPMGLALIAAVLERERHKVNLVDINAGIGPFELASKVADSDVVGITAMTPNINSALDIAQAVKDVRPTVPVILGGVHATLFPEEILKASPEIDIVVRGEGEETAVEVVEALGAGWSLKGIQGISYRENGAVVSSPPRCGNTSLNLLPFPDYHLLPLRRYRPNPPRGRALPFAVVITSRGCPYRCAYCSKPVFGNRFRAQSPERVVAEMSYYRDEFGVREFAIYDDVFTLDKKRSHAMADGMMAKGLKAQWTCETRVDLVDRELLVHMKRAGCYCIAYGIESGSQEMLDALCKGTTIEQAEEAIRMTREVGIQTVGYFMVGSPGESPEMVRSTIDLAKKLRLDFAQFSVTTPLPGSKLYDMYVRGRKRGSAYESFAYAGAGRRGDPDFGSDLLNGKEIQDWVGKAYREFYLRPSYLWQRLRHTTCLGDLKVGFRGLSMLMEGM